MVRLQPLVLAIFLGAGCLQASETAPQAGSETSSTGPPSVASASPSASAPARPNPAGNASAPAQPKPEKIASGHIVVGGPHGRAFYTLAVLGVPNVDAFFFKAPKAGTNVTTVTKDNRGLGYDLDFNFHDASGTWLGGCQTSKRDEVCIVPKGASRGEVAAYSGADLDIDVFTAPDKEGTATSRGLGR